MGGRLVPGPVAQRILDGIDDEAEREVATEIVRRAADILAREAWRLNGERSLSPDAMRRVLNAVGVEYTR